MESNHENTEHFFFLLFVLENVRCILNGEKNEIPSPIASSSDYRLLASAVSPLPSPTLPLLPDQFD